MDLDKLQKDADHLAALVDRMKKAEPAALREFAVGLRDVLVSFLKDRKEPIRPGQWFKDAAAKNIVPGDIAPRADALLIRWAGHVTPQDPSVVKEDAAKFSAVAEKTIPILKAYKKEK
jgi:hypothetical protein